MSDISDQQFLQEADRLMQALLARLDEFDPDELEADSAAGVIKMAFADRSVCVLNRQTAAHQIWLAVGATAWHFEKDPSGVWMDTKERGPLADVLGEILTSKLGRAIELAF
ncbi:MAG: iron donor protein CyaY [Planctomycetota bacterium]